MAGEGGCKIVHSRLLTFFPILFLFHLIAVVSFFFPLLRVTIIFLYRRAFVITFGLFISTSFSRFSVLF